MSQTSTERAPLVAQLLYSGLGGHGGVVFAMIEADKQRRWRHTLGFVGVEPLLPAYAEQCAAKNVAFTYFPAIARQPWRSYAAIYYWLRSIRPDAIVLHNPPALLPVWLYARRWLKPVIVVEHQPNKLKTRQDWLFSRLAMRFADAVVVLTPDYHAELAATLRDSFRPEKVRVIANGVSTNILHLSSSLDRPSKAVRIGMAARFTDTKRFDLLLDMLQILRTRRPAIEWQLTLAGSGELWDGVRRAGERAGLGSSLTLEGLLIGPALSEWYRHLDIYCHASDGETLSVSVLQAMAARLPIVGSDVEGISNLLGGEPPTGRLVQDNTGKAFADTVERLIDQAAAAKGLGDQARLIVEQKYSNDVMFSSYCDLIADISDR